MELVLIKSPDSPDEQVFHLKIGSNSLGSGEDNDVRISESGILPHHMNIEYSKEALLLSTIQSESIFHFQGKPCKRALVKPGEAFTVEDITFFCHALSGPDQTQHAMYLNPLIAMKAAVQQASPPTMQ